MEFYSKRPEMLGCESTIKFVKRIADLIHAFNSQNGKSALRKYDTHERLVIRDFIDYLKKCKHSCSDSGMKGLKVTCSVALELADFLLQNGYDFVMLTRFNQDNLERFFGMVRAYCGNNDNPDPQMFLLIFRLTIVYSLVKPSRGSNVTGEELFTTLIQDSELESDDASQTKWKRVNEALANIFEEFCDVDSTGNLLLTEDQRLLEFLAGYIGMKASKLRNCAACARTFSVPRTDYSLQSATRKIDSIPSLIELRDYHDALHYPTKSLFFLISVLEENVRAVIGTENTLHPNTFIEIAERLEILPSLPTVGCAEHKLSVCNYIVQFYVILRMHFAAKAFNSNIQNCKKAAEMRKMGKIIQGSGNSARNVTENNSKQPRSCQLKKAQPTKEEFSQKIEKYARTIDEVVAKYCSL